MASEMGKEILCGNRLTCKNLDRRFVSLGMGKNLRVIQKTLATTYGECGF